MRKLLGEKDALSENNRNWIMFTVGNGDVMSTAMSTAISVDSRSI